MSDFVTVVAVNAENVENKSHFITVLSINHNDNNQNEVTHAADQNETEIVTVYRLPGERLGFGLKFQGGSNTSENLERLFIQSCDPDSPASKARASWGPLSEGDEVLQIDNELVKNMTRIECVKCLKDKNVAINLLVKRRINAHGKRNEICSSSAKKRSIPPPPPVVPPRKINKKPIIAQQVQNTFSIKESFEIPTPVAAENYLNTLEDIICHNDESDETGSTISSQISVVSNFSSESDLPVLTTNISKNDFTKILSKPFQKIEQEFNVFPSSKNPQLNNILWTPLDESEIKLLETDEMSKKDEKSHQSMYENIDVMTDGKSSVLPTPHPRSSSIHTKMSKTSSEAPIKTVESWLNDAKTTEKHNIDNNDKRINLHSHEQSWESIGFGCFAAEDDDEDEKLGPHELLNISQAYFNSSWCCASSSSANNLPTIGEAEEEFPSLEPAREQNKISTVSIGPIFIVNAENESEKETNLVTQYDNFEINNNFSYPNESKNNHLNDKREDKIQNESQYLVPCHVPTENISSEKYYNGVENEKEKCIENMNEIILSRSFEMNSETNEEQLFESIGEEIKLENFEKKDLKNDLKGLKMKSIYNTDKIMMQSVPPTAASSISQQTLHSETKMIAKTNVTKTSLSPCLYQNSTNIQLVPSASDNSNMEKRRNLLNERRFLWNEPNSKFETENQDKTDMTVADNKSNQLPTQLVINKATAIVAPFAPRKILKNDIKLPTSKQTSKQTLASPMNRLRSFYWYNKDERSEKSVKDKIAMFSNSTSDISHILPKTFKSKAPTEEPYKFPKNLSSFTKSSSDISTICMNFDDKDEKKAMSVENLFAANDDMIDKSEEKKRTNQDKNCEKFYLSEKNQFPNQQFGKTKNIQTLSESRIRTCQVPTKALNERKKENPAENSKIQLNENYQKSMTRILENRKKSMSKLRGLVIPTKVPEIDLCSKKVIGLPVIKSKDYEMISGRKLLNANLHKKEYLDGSATNLKTIIPPLKPPRTSLTSQSIMTINTDESDTDFGLSSDLTTSSTLGDVSPQMTLTRSVSCETNTSISSSSTLTSGSGSGSQASCSSNNSISSTRPTKSTEFATSRKSILALSKSRTGREYLDKSWNDEESTDGGNADDFSPRNSKSKATMQSIVNHKVASLNDNLVGKTIKIGKQIEILSSDSDEKPNQMLSKVSSKSSIEKENLSSKYKKKNLTDSGKLTRQTDLSNSNKKTQLESKEYPKFVKNLVKKHHKPINLSEIRKNFEKSTINSDTQSSVISVFPCPINNTKENAMIDHKRFSSWDSFISSSSGVSSEIQGSGNGTNNSESLQTLPSDFGSFSSYDSSHSLITSQDLQLIIDEADPPLNTTEVFVVVLHREVPESTIGITLAGGSDYEAKEITIHRILKNSPADKDGRLKIGDRLLSINGLSMRGLTHRESLSVLKSPRTDVVIVATRSESNEKAKSVSNIISATKVECKLNKRKETESILKDDVKFNEREYDMFMEKDETGLGGAAEKTSNLNVGDEILAIDGKSIVNQTRIEVWNMIKKIPQGKTVQLRLKKKV
ncbi:CLUMA_CG020171, isoform A [Clunio marinus]|uniref:CLUMA_CG020171, isoform A n=1 Tax=Clunio marinus TaxID=568069 RepID=A0A1J1J5F3_9DIPT|nr:CLUMA_CG020171, isoform A [Clunio marinus]